MWWIHRIARVLLALTLLNIANPRVDDPPRFWTQAEARYWHSQASTVMLHWTQARESASTVVKKADSLGPGEDHVEVARCAPCLAGEHVLVITFTHELGNVYYLSAEITDEEAPPTIGAIPPRDVNYVPLLLAPGAQ